METFLTQLHQRMLTRRRWATICESPIELDIAVFIEESPFNQALKINGIELRPQYPWRRFRVDFAFLRNHDPRLFVECDGKDFHSTQEQIQRDRLKDKFAEIDGIPMLRFSGKEIYRDVHYCINRILHCLIEIGEITK